jgi:hypothetical protein
MTSVFRYISTTESRSPSPPLPCADEEKALEWYEAALKASSNHN